jgi:ABC-type molybdenum transport system ATPase subunit/photorepair protein PhrA
MTTVPLLEAERLTVRRAGRAVLDDVSMAVAGGTWWRCMTLRPSSGGEQQGEALARALAGGANLLLVDEPTAELDEANRDRARAPARRRRPGHRGRRSQTDPDGSSG